MSLFIIEHFYPFKIKNKDTADLKLHNSLPSDSQHFSAAMLDSPDSSDLELGLAAGLLGFDHLISDDGGSCAA